MNLVNRRFADFQRQKSGRQFEVQLEITMETSREVMDPMALGLRYRELQLIAREVEAEQAKTRTDLQALLTPAPKPGSSPSTKRCNSRTPPAPRLTAT